jgi:hypothetical protein
MSEKMSKAEGIEELKGCFTAVFRAVCPEGRMQEAPLCAIRGTRLISSVRVPGAVEDPIGEDRQRHRLE